MPSALGNGEEDENEIIVVQNFIPNSERTHEIRDLMISTTQDAVIATAARFSSCRTQEISSLAPMSLNGEIEDLSQASKSESIRLPRDGRLLRAPFLDVSPLHSRGHGKCERIEMCGSDREGLPTEQVGR